MPNEVISEGDYNMSLREDFLACFGHTRCGITVPKRPTTPAVIHPPHPTTEFIMKASSH